MPRQRSQIPPDGPEFRDRIRLDGRAGSVYVTTQFTEFYRRWETLSPERQQAVRGMLERLQRARCSLTALPAIWRNHAENLLRIKGFGNDACPIDRPELRHPLILAVATEWAVAESGYDQGELTAVPREEHPAIVAFAKLGLETAPPSG